MLGRIKGVDPIFLARLKTSQVLSGQNRMTLELLFPIIFTSFSPLRVFQGGSFIPLFVSFGRLGAEFVIGEG
jgi:hypothetical protein